MRLIPGKTKVKIELFKNISLIDMGIALLGVLVLALAISSSLPGKLYICIGIVLLWALLLARLDAEPNYTYIVRILRHFNYKRRYERVFSDEDLARMNTEGAKEVAFEKLFSEEKKPLKPEKKGKKKPKKEKETAAAQPAESKAEAKARRKAEKAERKADDKILKSKKATKEEKDAIWLKRAQQSAAKKQQKTAVKKEKKRAAAGNQACADMKDIMAFTGIQDDFIEYGGKYYGAAIEIPAVEFRFFSPSRRTNSIENGVGRILRSLSADYGANIVKLERPVIYDDYIANEYKKLDDLKNSYEQGIISEAEMQSRVEILYNRINDLENLKDNDHVIQPFYYIVLFDSDKRQLNMMLQSALTNLEGGELKPHRLNTKELAVFLRYTNELDFDEREIDNIDPKDYTEWAMAKSVNMTPRTVEVNHIVTHNFRIINYPTVVGDAWLANLMSIPATKVVVKCRPMDHMKSIRAIDHSLQELRSQWSETRVDSKRLELEEHVSTLSSLLSMLQGDNETLLETNIYVTAYDIARTREHPTIQQPPISDRSKISNMKKVVRSAYQEQGFRLNNMEFGQFQAFVGGQVSGWDPMRKEGRGIPTNTVAAIYPWVFAHVSDHNGIKLGSESGVPVFIDFFRRDSERVNSNMVIVGKSGSGKSYATKSLLSNLAADDAKIFILDPENEYTELANSLHGKFINVGNAQFGRLNPFHIITALDDDESDGSTVSGSYATHLQFLEEFYRQIMPDCEKDAMEYLNSLTDRMYTNMGITAETDLSRLKPEDYPIFDDLYDAILEEFQATDNAYIRTMLRTLTNYVSKFSTGGRNANIWNGPSTVTTEENFTVFNFQSLLANRNGTIANAQMLLVLKYIDNEIIKNRDYNTKYGLHRKVVVVIDEAHVFIDTKFPVALDFMFQLAKRIRKYNGMQIVITQNIKDFVGSEEIARKSTAIINACQYSFIFALAPNDMDDLCKLYEKAGGINEQEQEQIVQAGRGRAFTIMSPTSRSSFKVEVPQGIVHMFENGDFESEYFFGEEGAENWEAFMGDSRAIREENVASRRKNTEEDEETAETKRHVEFHELSAEELVSVKPARKQVEFTELDEDDDFDIPEIPDDPEEFAAMLAEKHAEPAPAPVVVPQVVTQSDPVLRDMMSQLIGKLGDMTLRTPTAMDMDAMMAEMRRSLREEILREVEERTAALAPAAPAVAAPTVRYEAQPDDYAPAPAPVPSTGTALGSIFNPEALAEAARLDAEEAAAKAAQAASKSAPDDGLGDFDLDSLLDGLLDEPAAPAEKSNEEPKSGVDGLLEGLLGDGGFDVNEYLDHFDITEFLEEESQTMVGDTAIDLMVTYDRMTAEISLEDLVKFNAKKKRARK